MQRVEINNKVYFTNITDNERLNKCFNFYADGCSSYAVSFDNIGSSIIQKCNLEGVQVYYLRYFNFEKCFIPAIGIGCKDARELLQKGLDLIEIL